MNQAPPKETNGLFKSIFAAQMILLLHVVLIAVVGCLVLFFRGVVTYMPWIFLGGSAAIIGGCYLFFRHMKKEGKALREMLSLPAFNGKSIEVSVLGGLASLKLEGPAASEAPELEQPEGLRRLALPESTKVQDLIELGHMLDNNLITRDEYDRAKDELMNQEPGSYAPCNPKKDVLIQQVPPLDEHSGYR